MSAYVPFVRRLRTTLTLADGLGMLVAVWLAYLVRFAAAAHPPRLLETKLEQLLANPGLLIWALVAGWTLGIACELYEPEVLNRRREIIVRVVVMLAGWTTAIAVATYLRPVWGYGRGVLALTAGFWLPQLVLVRWLFASWMRRRPRFTALVVGDPEAVEGFCAALRARPSSPWRPIDGAALDPDRIPEEIARCEVSIVVVAGSDERAAIMGHDLTALHFSGVPVVAASEIWAWLEERLPLDALTPAVFLHQPGFGGVHWKLFNRMTRVADVVLASFFLVLAAPVLLMAALAIVVADGAPVLYRQRRVGQYGRLFTMLKLRTMLHDAEPRGPAFADRDDPRTSRLGRLLRRFRIDELPQLWNVIKGEMSLVGPRPERPEFVARLSEEIRYYAFRTAVPPGITGWAQVNSPYANDLEGHRRKLEFDLYFIRERSMRLYLVTLLRTASAALVGTERALLAPATTDPADAGADEREVAAGRDGGAVGLGAPLR